MPAFAFDLFAHRKAVKRAPSGSCQLYKEPKMGATLNSSTPVTFEWDPSCLGDAQYIDISLLSARGTLFRWSSVPAASGKHECQLDAGWWDQQNTVQVQLGITASDEPLALSPFPAGPVFTARNSDPIPTVSTPSNSSVSGTRTSSTPAPTGNYAGAGGVVNVQQLYSSQQAQHRGRLAASIILPLLVAILVSVGGYIWYSRRREAKRRQQWVQSIDKRMSRVSADWQSMSAIGGRPSMQSGRSRTMSHLGGGAAHGRSSLAPENTRPSIYERFKSSTSVVDNEKNVFAAEDLSQLGPRARALSAAAAEGRPLSELYKDLPAAPAASATGVTRARSKSIAHDGSGLRTSGFLPRPAYDRAPASHARTTSTTSNNPYASAMAQRDSQAMDEKALYAFPTSSGGNLHSGTSPIQRSRLDSSNSGPTPRTRLDSATGRGRVTSRVSFADTPRPNERRWNHADAEKNGVGRVSVGDAFAVDFDSLPALALMRVKSGEGLEGSAPDSPFTPTREFIPGSKDDHLGARQGTGIGGRTPDEMLKAYAAAMAGEKGELGQEMEMGTARGQMRPRQEEESGGIFSSVRKLWRK